MSARHRGKRIRRKDVAAIVDAEAALLAGFAVAAGCDRAAAEDLAQGALDALWRRGTDLAEPAKRRCFLLRAMAAEQGFAASPQTVGFLRTRCGLTASQAGYVLDATVGRIESFAEARAEAEPRLSRELRRRILIRAGRLLLPVRRLAILGIVLVFLAACMLALAAMADQLARKHGAATRPAEPPAASREGPSSRP